MAIPDYQTLMLPVLQMASDGNEHKASEMVEKISDDFQLSLDERTELLASGNQAVINNRIGWARSYLKKAGLLDSSRRGYVRITDKGRALLRTAPERINVKLLDQYPEFVNFREGKSETANQRSDDDKQSEDQALTPEDALADAYVVMTENLQAEVLSIVLESTPAFFERLVVDLLVGMGYGGNRQDAGRAMGKSGDGGIDGIINEDRLGLDVIYIQAKRWEGNVGRPEIQKFAGALQGQRAKKGVFITTSNFTKDALEYVSLIDTRIILIDGKLLTKLMIEFNIGVSTVGRYEVKSIDTDYFDN